MTTNELTERLDDLEAQLEDQQETIERQQERLKEQDAIIQSQRERLDEEATPATEAETTGQDPAEPETADDDSERPGPIATRRGVLTAGSVLGLLGLGAGSASADASGQIGTSSDPLKTLYTEELNGGVTDDTPLTNIAGSNLSIDNSGNLNAAGGGSGSWVEGDNTNLLEPDSKDGIEVDTVADNGSGSVTLNSALDLTDNQINYGTNAGTQTLVNLPFGSSQTAGSTNSYAMQLDGDDILTINGVNDGSGNLNNAYLWAKKELRLDGTLNAQAGTIENTTGGLTVTTNDNGNLTLNPGSDSSNDVFLKNLENNDDSILTVNSSGKVGVGSKAISDIGGGGSSSTLKTSNGNLALEVIDTPSAPAIVGGSGSNGLNQLDDGDNPAGAVITGGGHSTGSNEVGDNFATVGGGMDNRASAYGGTIPGGKGNRASGDYSFCAGRVADANNNNGAFVWGDSSSTKVSAGAADEVRFQATGGFVIAPRLDKTTMLDVKDKDGHTLLAADTENDKVQVFDGTESDSVDVSHDGTDGVVSTSSGAMKLNPSGILKLDPSGNVELFDSDIVSDNGFNITTNGGDLKLDPIQSLTLTAGGPLTKPVEVTGAPFTRETTSKSSEYDLDKNQGKYFVEVDTSSNNVTIHLPDSPSVGEEHVIKKSASANTLTIDADNEKIDGSTTIELTNQYASRKVIWGGSNWHVTSEVAGVSST